MRVRFQADADLNEDIIDAVLRLRREVDFRRATEASLQGLTDLEVLARAAAEGRILVTHDRTTMPVHFAAFVHTADSPGVLIVPQRSPVAAIASDLVLIWQVSPPDEWRNVLGYLPL